MLRREWPAEIRSTCPRDGRQPQRAHYRFGVYTARGDGTRRINNSKRGASTAYPGRVIPRELPMGFRKNILGAFTNGAAWLDSLPELIAACERHWHIVVGTPFEFSYSYVAPARNARGEEFVLKVCVAGPEFTSEIGALQAWSGVAAVRLLDYHVEFCALLLERLTPGGTLASLDDDA